MRHLIIGLAATLVAGAAVAQPATNATPGATPGMTGNTAPGMTTAPSAPMTGAMRPGAAIGSPMVGTTPAPSTGTTMGSTTTSSNSNPAIATGHPYAAVPARGHNSFTMAQARKRLESNGFTNVAGLVKDRDGVWRGHGQKNGSSTNVWLDYKGDVGG